MSTMVCRCASRREHLQSRETDCTQGQLLAAESCVCVCARVSAVLFVIMIGNETSLEAKSVDSRTHAVLKLGNS